MMLTTAAAAPTANLGAQAHAAGQIKNALLMLETALPNVPLDSPLHKACMTSINALAKSLPQGQTPGNQESLLRDMALRQQQMSPMVAAMQARGAPGAPPPGGPGAQPPAPQGA